ncbi:hypothetical protein WKV44_08265 [Spirochaetia bacterium 38H-sp]|uniref:Flavodoxin-like domain-containing protein n=1 Tax=Rarispira pelagica TaxID=3141764 RepID=A0ABU9UCZ0_9SPIR
MRVAVVFFAGGAKEKFLDIAQGFSRGLGEQGHIADVIDIETDYEKKLTSYNYIVLGAATSGFFKPKVSDKLKKFLSSCGHIAGKRCFAFVPKRSFASKALLAVMSAMEHEGLYIKNSGIVSSAEEAAYIGKSLHIGGSNIS